MVRHRLLAACSFSGARAPPGYQRTDALHNALQLLAARHNALGLTSDVEPAVVDFHVGVNDAVRPYRVINAGQFVDACRKAIAEKALRHMVTVGTFDQLTHGDDALVNFTTWPAYIDDL